jgi:hypothetical protein
MTGSASSAMVGVRRIKHYFWAAALLFLGSCTYYVPAQLATSRSGDTLSVALAGNGAARWDPEQDSLVFECAGCTDEPARKVEHFRDRRHTTYDLRNAQGVTLTLYSLGQEQTLTVPGIPPMAGTHPEQPELSSRHERRSAEEEKSEAIEKSAAKEQAAKEQAAKEQAAKKAASLKVTAAEGVAIYKDKTKTEVLKIVPQGSVLILLSKEGDLYSVSVDGDEGFVDAAAVEEQN